MRFFKALYQRMLIDGMNGLTMGLFATIVAGTVFEQIGLLVGGEIGNSIISLAAIIKSLMGVGIGVGVATKLSNNSIVYATAAVVGYLGAFSTDIINKTIVNNGSIGVLCDGGQPLTAFFAVYLAVETSRLVAGRTKMDYFITPIIMLIVGGASSMYIGTPISFLMEKLGGLISWSMTQNQVLIGMIIAIIMGMSLTLPISSLAIAMSLNLSGVAAGAAAIGCCANMIGFAAASFRDNKIEGFLLQSIGTSSLQMPNIIKNPIIFIPVIITSATLGPVAICVGKVTGTVQGAGMGSCALIAQVTTFESMILGGVNRNSALIQIMLFMFILPAIMSWVISEALRKKGLIKENDMKIIL